MNLLSVLLNAVRDEYQADSTKAGVVISQLGYESFYVSVCRYPTGPASKALVVSAKGNSLDDAISACVMAWLVHTGKVNSFRLQAGFSKKYLASLLAQAVAA